MNKTHFNTHFLLQTNQPAHSVIFIRQRSSNYAPSQEVTDCPRQINFRIRKGY